jgi:DNA-binding HxlR family transcriptional regulator
MEHEFHLCPKFEAAFKLLGKPWTGLIINVLLDGPKRFKEISSVIPNLSDKMLAGRFKELEAEKIIKRKVYDESPVRVEYELTEKGKSLEPMMKECQKWADVWVEK